MRVTQPSLVLWLRRLFLILRTEGAGASRESAAIGIGVFIGCLPTYGLHLLLCTAAGTAFGLNRLKMYLAANISNPFVAPWLILLEIQVGALLRRGSFHPLTIEAVKTSTLAGVTADFLIGSFMVGIVLGGIAGGVTYVLARGTRETDAFGLLVRAVADRYIDCGIVAWEFARRKLTADPVYRAVLCGGLLTRQPGRGSTLLDVGCGMGLSLALTAEAVRASKAGTWPAAWPAPPQFDRLVGIELRRRVATLASSALSGDALVIAGDALAAVPDRCESVLLFDVLQMMRRDEQEALITALSGAIAPDGVMLIREADASAGWRFTIVRLSNRLKSLAFGAWRQPFHFRSAAEWSACFARHGFDADMRQMSANTPFANVLFVVTPAGQALSRVINRAGSTRTDATASATTLTTDTRPIERSGGYEDVTKVP